jgi:hypothetical protein
MTEKTHVLYRMFNAEGELLYVGITNNPKMRFRTHSKTQPWWSEVTNIAIENHSTREALAVAEQRAIRSEGPRYNVAYTLAPLPVPVVVRKPKCPTCASPQPQLMPIDDEVLLLEDGSTIPICLDVFHFPDDPELAETLSRNRQLLRQLRLIQMSAIAKERLARQRAAMEKTFGGLNWDFSEATS